MTKQTDKDNFASILDTLDKNQSAIMQAMALQKRCAEIGFDWDTLEPVAEKVQEELVEVMEEAKITPKNQQRIEEELGDLFFALINLARHLNCAPETTLKKANLKFEKRFRFVEQKVIEQNKNLQDCSLNELEAFWQQSKKHD